MSSQADTRERRTSRNTRKLAFGAMFTALALIFSYVEFLVPLPIPVPGIKLGLANLVIIIAIYRMGFKYAFTINCVRII
ncbi:MAG: Gx transporter family protein, partial [Anaerovoracaceae bacterium]